MTPLDPHVPQTTSVKPPTPMLQYRLRTLMLASAVCSVGFATMVYVGPLWALTLGFFVLMIVAHVAANAIGTTLRNQAPRALATPSPQNVRGVRIPAAQRHHLHDRTRPGWSIIFLTLAGAAGGVLIGRLVFLQVDQGQLSTGDWVVGLGSFAVIAGLLGFMASCFVRIGCRRS